MGAFLKISEVGMTLKVTMGEVIQIPGSTKTPTERGKRRYSKSFLAFYLLAHSLHIRKMNCSQQAHFNVL